MDYITYIAEATGIEPAGAFTRISLAKKLLTIRFASCCLTNPLRRLHCFD